MRFRSGGAVAPVTPAALLAAGSAACAVLAAWDALGAAEEARVARAAARWVARPLAVLRSGREPTSPERRRLALLGTLSLAGAGWLVAGPIIAALLAAAGPWVARSALAARRRRRTAALVAGAAGVARTLADALTAGHSVRGALIEAAAAGGSGAVPGPAGEELRAVGAALELGEPTETVLAGLAARARAPAYDVLVAAVLLQRDAGGNLAELLRSLAVALEERARVEADARSATAQARFTAMLVAGLPVAGAVLGELAQPGFLAGVAAEPLPAMLAGCALVLQVLALVLVRRIARVGEPR